MQCSLPDLIHGPFAVINADDYYGPGGFTQMYDYLCNEADGDVYDCAMIGYRLENTVRKTATWPGAYARCERTAALAGH